MSDIERLSNLYEVLAALAKKIESDIKIECKGEVRRFSNQLDEEIESTDEFLMLLEDHMDFPTVYRSSMARRYIPICEAMEIVAEEIRRAPLAKSK